MRLYVKIPTMIFILLLFTCYSFFRQEFPVSEMDKNGRSYRTEFFSFMDMLGAQEFPPEHCPIPGKKVLALGQKIAFVDREVIRGSCYRFVETVYNRAGYTADRRTIVFSRDRRGPFADPKIIKPGDWVMHVNLEFRYVGHSCIFVQWLDRKKHVGQMLDYVGMNRKQPASYRAHRLSRVFKIIRGHHPEQQ